MDMNVPEVPTAFEEWAKTVDLTPREHLVAHIAWVAAQSAAFDALIRKLA
jgi:hypothetical protein